MDSIRVEHWQNGYRPIINLDKPEIHQDNRNKVENLLKFVFLFDSGEPPTVIVREVWDKEKDVVRYDVVLGKNTIAAAIEIYTTFDLYQDSSFEIDGVLLHLLPQNLKNRMLRKWIRAMILPWNATDEYVENFVNAYRGGNE